MIPVLDLCLNKKPLDNIFYSGHNKNMSNRNPDKLRHDAYQRVEFRFQNGTYRTRHSKVYETNSGEFVVRSGMYYKLEAEPHWLYGKKSFKNGKPKLPSYWIFVASIKFSNSVPYEHVKAPERTNSSKGTFRKSQRAFAHHIRHRDNSMGDHNHLLFDFINEHKLVSQFAEFLAKDV